MTFQNFFLAETEFLLGKTASEGVKKKKKSTLLLKTYGFGCNQEKPLTDANSRGGEGQ